MLRRSLVAVSLGSWLGLSAGVATALSDFGAHWLFMESAVDRVWLGVRLLSLQAAFGVALGVGLTIAVGGTSLIARAVPQRYVLPLRALCLAILASPILRKLASLLWGGGMMSRLPLRWYGVQVTCFALISAFAAAVFASALLSTRALAADTKPWRRMLFALLAAAFGVGKLNQLVLPNLYGYLHTTLSAITFALYAFSARLLWLRALAARPKLERWLWLGAPLGALVLVFGCASLRTLENNQNVRVALLSGNVPNSRSLLQVARPLLPNVHEATLAAAKQRAAAATQRRHAQPLRNERLPELPDAHVLLITIDALRADHLGLHGYARATTPQLDALGAQGVVFEHAYAQAPHSSYSLCSLMTSEYLHETTELGAKPPEQTLPRVLAENGYHSAGFYTQGIFHTAAEQLGNYEHEAFGFALHDHQDRPAELMTDRALLEIDRTIARGEPSALFWVHYFDVHEPYEATTFGTRDLDRYDSELLAADAAIGRLVKEARSKLGKPVIVVITADHGEEFHEHGGVYHGSSLYEEQVHVPLLMLAPGVAPRRVAQPVESIDIAPTLLGLVDIDRPSHMRGTDLRPLFATDHSERGPVFSAVTSKKMVVSWPYKLIADLRFGAFELYNLELDPHERDNRADREPERVHSLRGEIYAWLDSLAPAGSELSHAEQALEWGRLGDRRAVEPLARLVVDDTASAADRCEAARLLGKLADPTTADALLTAAHSPAAWVAAEAAIALGRMFDERAGPPLRKLVNSEDLSVRSRAAVSLGRLRDKAAVPALIDALWVAPSAYDREEAVRWLGRLRDPSALNALLEVLPEAHTRHLVVVALGEIGDPRAFEALIQVLDVDRNTNVRDGVVRGLTMLGDKRALPVILQLATTDAALRNSGEALLRLGALEQQLIAGVDADLGLPAQPGTSGLTRCERGAWWQDWDFAHRTHCESDRDRVQLLAAVPERVANAPHGSTLLVELRRVDTTASVSVQIRIGARSQELQVDGVWREARIAIPAHELPHGTVAIELLVREPGARLALDHALIIPRAP